VLPRFEVAARRRPVALVSPLTERVRTTGDVELPLPRPAPYAAVEACVDGPARLDLRSGGTTLSAVYDGSAAWVEIDGEAHRSRRRARPEEPPEGLALLLTGPQATVLTRAGDRWTARARTDLTDVADVHDPAFGADLVVRTDGVTDVLAGGFGQVGLRDLRWVTTSAGETVVDPDGRLLLTATHAGPGHFPTGHTGVWSFDPETFALQHTADLWFRRPGGDGVFGDHATHLVRDGDGWLVATSTWGDFDKTPGRLRVVLARSAEDLITGVHTLDTVELPLPTEGPSVGVWDPHLVRTDDGWLVGYVSARRWWRFHPCLATGPSLDALTLRAAATGRLATEGTTLAQIDGTWRVLASDGRDGRRGQRERYPVLDLDLREIGALDAPYPTNLPWPSVTQRPDGSWLMAAFDGTRWGGDVLGYGTHGDVVLLRG